MSGNWVLKVYIKENTPKRISKMVQKKNTKYKKNCCVNNYIDRLAELHVPAAIAPAIELLELYEQWNDCNEHVIDEFIRFDAMYYIPLHDTTIPSIIKAAKIFAGYGD